MKKILSISLAVLFFFPFLIFAQIPTNILVQISRAEDELRFDKILADLMRDKNANIRARAALAAGRIGKEAAIPTLVELLGKDTDGKVRATAAFALGEIESIKSADALLTILQNTKNANELRARAVEAAGKIAAANAKDAKGAKISEAVLDTLKFENSRGAAASNDVILLGITAILRAKPADGEAMTAKFLTSANPRIRADAANTLSRLRAKNANVQLRSMLLADKDPIARANAARALGAAEDKDAFDILLKSAVTDIDSRVRVSAIRSLGSLKDTNAADKLLTRGEILLSDYKKSKFVIPNEKSELLEIAVSLGRLLRSSKNEQARYFLVESRKPDGFKSPEINIALAQVFPEKGVFLNKIISSALNKEIEEDNWQVLDSAFQGLAEFANFPEKLNVDAGYIGRLNDSVGFQGLDERLYTFLKLRLNDSSATESNNVKAIPNALRAFTKFKSKKTNEILLEGITHFDVIVRATAAELLAEQPTTIENVRILKTAFNQALLQDEELNDAQLAILDALFKLDKKEAVPTLLTALDALDYLVRKKAFELLGSEDLRKDFPNIKANVDNAKAKNKNRVLPYNLKTKTKLGQILNTKADYIRAVSRKSARALLTTEKGSFTIEFSPVAAPLTVDNFIKLAKAKYFDGLAIHRVVPNFVMQDGDPRGDGNGGPGWSIRDEINDIPFERGTVGMALSGKDTGGSQWFVCHAPQPHLDGGYTVFGRVSETDMKVVDNLVRGDKILSVKIIEGGLPQRTQRIQKRNN